MPFVLNKKQLLKAALDWLKPYDTVEKIAQLSARDAAWLAIAFSRLDQDRALLCLQTALSFESPTEDASAVLSDAAHGWILGHLYQTAKNKAVFLQQLRPVFQQILDFHRFLYGNCDLSGDGLIATASGQSEGVTRSHTLTYFEDPFFNAMLIWSNEQLIRLGGLLKHDVQELMEWNDLAVWSMNEKLWSENAGLYLPHVLKNSQTVFSASITGMMPLAAGIPTQEQAERMLETLLQGDFQIPDIATAWLLYKGLLRYGMQESAADLKKEAFASIEDHLADSASKAAIYIEWLCAAR